MEDLLTPQICMDIDDTPLDVGKDSSDDESDSSSSSHEEDDDHKVQKLLELEFKHPAQVPENLTDQENDAKKNVFAAGELTVEYHRLHCTACNIHLGSAPITYFNRYIHPLLKVIICKSCYDFYCSGEFDKDEDGSEMYCRWCGQGGKVMCCAQCAYVFCQKCVRQNLGKKTLEIIKDSDDWLCFACNPSQLINLKIICSALYDFTQEEIRLAKAISNVERLKVDHSMCCGRTRSSSKRKKDEDETYNPYVDENRFPKRIKPSKTPETVVCAPDLSTLISDNNKITSPKINKENKVIPTTTNNTKKFVNIQPAPSKSFFVCPTTNICKPNNTNVIRIQTPAVKVVAATPTSVPLISSIPVQLIPGTKHDWFEKAATVVSTITGNLSFTLDTLTNELKGSKTVENLAQVHNKLQELLSTSINSLIQVRKSLRNQFLEDLNHLKFTTQQSYSRNQLIQASQNVTKGGVVNVTEDDDDVVIVNSNLTTNSERPKEGNKERGNNGRPYLKVRSVSQLLKVPAECITIPDDPPNDIEMKPSKKDDDKKDVVDEVVKNKATDSIKQEDCEKQEEDNTEIQEKDKEKLEKDNEKQEKNNEKQEKDNEKQEKDNSEMQVEENNEKSEKENCEEDKLNEDPLSLEKESSEIEKETETEPKDNLNKIIDEEIEKKNSTEKVENEEVNNMLSEEVLLPTSSEQSENENEEWINEDFEDHLACAIVPNKTGEITTESVQCENDDDENCDNNSQNKNDSEKNKTDSEENKNDSEENKNDEKVNTDEVMNNDETSKDELINKDEVIKDDEMEENEEIEKSNDEEEDEAKKTDSNEIVESESVEMINTDSKSGEIKETEKDSRTDESNESISESDKDTVGTE